MRYVIQFDTPDHYTFEMDIPHTTLGDPIVMPRIGETVVDDDDRRYKVINVITDIPKNLVTVIARPRTIR